jgi:alkylation response protein AidB-like acyl-CoA dehydrogenase
MDLSYGEEYEAFRAEVRAFLEGWPLQGEEAGLPPAQQEQIFRRRGIERGYVYRGIPRDYGGSGRPEDPLKDRILQEEYLRAGAPGARLDQGPGMLVPTLLEFGSEAQKRRFIPPTLSGEMLWCQGYSEPNAGSDLASLQSSARLDGDAWVIDGQKIWTSNAKQAHYMFGLFRTEPAASKHAGISYLLVPMDSPGIEVRPLKQITGSLEFNEVFFDSVRIPADHIVGRRGEGWPISRATLKHERNLIGNPKLMRMQFDLLLQLARRTRRGGEAAIRDPRIRDRIAEIEGYVRACETCNLRMLSAQARGQELEVMLPMMMIKLFSTDVMQRVAKCAYDLVGGDGLVEPHEPDDGRYSVTGTTSGYVHNYIFSLGPAIAGGASNIQRNIIGERGLGLPRDLRPGPTAARGGAVQ